MKILFLLFFVSLNSFAQLSPEVRAKLLADSLEGKLNLTAIQKEKITAININTCKWIDQVCKNNPMAVEGHTSDQQKKIKEIEGKWTKSVKKMIGKRKLKRFLAKNKKAETKPSDFSEKTENKTFNIRKDYLGFDYLFMQQN